MSLRSRAREFWRSVRYGRPGHRFEDRYERAELFRHREHVVWRATKIVVGLGLIAVGIVELVLPGPAILFLVLGGALLAAQSRRVARAMDWTEVRGRRAWACVRRKPRSGSGGGKAALLLLLAALGGSALYPLLCDYAG